MNITTRTHPRTLEQAFGPYERSGLCVAPDPLHPHDRIALVACAIAAVCLVAVLFVWG